MRLVSGTQVILETTTALGHHGHLTLVPSKGVLSCVVILLTLSIFSGEDAEGHAGPDSTHILLGTGTCWSAEYEL